MCLYVTSQRTTYLQNTENKNTGQRSANIHYMLDILMSRSNSEVHIYEINENVTEKKNKNHSCSFSVYSELNKYA